jgi:hypothetical protein
LLPGTDSPLKRLDASTTPPVSANAIDDEKCCSMQQRLQPETQKTQVIESKNVINRELWVALQFPIGDDMSYSSRCEAWLGFTLLLDSFPESLQRPLPRGKSRLKVRHKVELVNRVHH